MGQIHQAAEEMASLLGQVRPVWPRHGQAGLFLRRDSPKAPAAYLEGHISHREQHCCMFTGHWRLRLTRETTLRQGRSNSKRASHPTILIVEDHSRLRAELRDWLMLTFPGCSVLDVGSGEEAVQFVESHSPDIVLMDLVLPGISGIEATSRIKTTAPQTNIIVLTFCEEMDWQPSSLQAGAINFIHKSEMAKELPLLLAPLLNH